MNENTLILTEHRILPRLFDTLLTLLAWCGFLLCLYINLLIQVTESDSLWETITASFSTVLIYLLIAMLNGWLLILWYHYNHHNPHTKRHGRLSSLNPDELARSFNVDPQIISEMSQGNLLTVYHDHIGHIIDLRISQQYSSSPRKPVINENA